MKEKPEFGKAVKSGIDHAASGLGRAAQAVQSTGKKGAQIVSEKWEETRERTRSLEILSVFAAHNFYVGGFTPRELRTTLEDLGPTYVKIGQIMSSRTDMLPAEYCRELEKLRSSVKPLEPGVVHSVIEQETGRSMEELYDQFCDEPIGSASIAQAHAAVLKDGRKVVTKVQRPGIADTMRKDFVLLKKLAGGISMKKEADDEAGTVDLLSVLGELEKVTEEELDFRVEAEHARTFRTLCIEDEERVSCPVVIDALTSEHMLTMTFVDGYSISDRERVLSDGLDCNEIGTRILENYFHQVLDVGIFHGDPHQGNIMISGGIPYWIDFGMIGRISESSLNVIQDAILALLQKNVEGLAGAVMALGKTGSVMNRAKLIEDLDRLMERYMSASSLRDLDVSALMGDLADLAAVHNISVPGEYTMLVRSLAALEGVIERFCPDVNVFSILSVKLIKRAKDNFDVREQLLSAAQSLLETGRKTYSIPTLLADFVRNLSRGRAKLNFELSGFDELMVQLNRTVMNVVLAVFACVLFIGSCMLCTTGITPQINGIPLIAMGGFVVAVALAIYTVQRFLKR